MGKMSYRAKAIRLFGKDARQLTVGPGDGQYALVTPCGDPAFSLWPTFEEAQKEMNDLSGCGDSGCWPYSHYKSSNR